MLGKFSSSYSELSDAFTNSRGKTMFKRDSLDELSESNDRLSKK